MKFYTSDLHLFHRNILRYEDRPYSSVEHMNSELIKNWNNRVSKGDEVYILGDFAFCDGDTANQVLDSLNGMKFLIRGNHDSFIKDKSFDRSKFVWVKDYAKITDGNDKVILFHFPIAVWDCQHHGAYHLYGHVHGNTNTKHPLLLDLGERSANVGVDVNNYEPKTLKELVGI